MDTYDKIDLLDFTDEIFDKIQGLFEKTELCQYLIDNYNVLSDEHLIVGLQRLAVNILNDEDYYKIIAMYDGKVYCNRAPFRLNRHFYRVPVDFDKEYHGPLDIRTTLYESVLNEDNEYKNMGVILSVLYTRGVNQVTYYSEERIKELLDKNKIVILNKKYNPNGAPYIAVPPTGCPNYELAFSDVDHKEFLSSEGKYYKTTISYIKSRFDCELLGELRDYLLTLIANEMDKAFFLQRQFEEKGFQKRIEYLQSK